MVFDAAPMAGMDDEHATTAGTGEGAGLDRSGDGMETGLDQSGVEMGLNRSEDGIEPE